MQTDDTIVAISTPMGRGGLGVVRLSGSEGPRIAQAVLTAAHSRTSLPPNPAGSEIRATGLAEAPPLRLSSWNVTYAELHDESGAMIDRVLVSFFQAPRSYTAEDIVEISCHGSPVVLEYLVQRCLQSGARLAEPGEFTMRAFLNGRIDLTQAEAVRDLIDSRTLYQAKVAAGQMEGAVSHRLAPAKKALVDLISVLEAGVDFAEDDVSVLTAEQIAARMLPVEQGLVELARSFATGKMIRQGLTLAIVGRPNVGKSSLFNALLQQDRAIVTATPGTTRDLVSETVEIEGIPLRFVDTAGIRQAYDEAETIGIRKSYEAAADSDVALLVLDGSQPIHADDRELLRRLDELGKLLVVVNKCDRPLMIQHDELAAELRHAETRAEGAAGNSGRILFVSALERRGIDELRHAIIHMALPALEGAREPQFVTSVRQEQLLRESLQALDAARHSLAAAVPHEMLLVDLYTALRPLDAITGATTVEDILGNIFSTFCIGK